MLTTFIFLALSAPPVNAENPCTNQFAMTDRVVASRYTTTSVGCNVRINPKQTQQVQFQYRDYWFDDRGRFQVVVSIPDDDIRKYLEEKTGYRTFFLFPRRELPSVMTEKNGSVTLRLTSGEMATFDENTAQLKTFPGKFTVNQEVRLDDQGGLEIQSFNGVWLDAGFKIGDQAYRDPNGSAVFHNSQGHECKIQNDEFFFYENMFYSEPNLRFPKDKELVKFLRERCPNIDVRAIEAILT